MRPRLAAILLLCAMPALAGDFRPFVRGSWQQLRQSHAGTPVIVHFWGLSCVPCVAELPQWGQLLRQRRDVSLVLVAADPVPEEAKQMTATLTKAGLASAERWIFADRFADRLRFEIDPDWAGELPFTLCITRDGKISRMTGTVDFAAVRAWIDAQRL
jgi:thiol-disulfide isomerase/thioredoxin